MDVTFSHLGICVSDLERSVRFYCEGLGFELVQSHTVGPEFGRLMEVDDVALQSRFVRRDGVSIELLHFDSPGHSGEPARRPMNQLGITHLSLTGGGPRRGGARHRGARRLRAAGHANDLRVVRRPRLRLLHRPRRGSHRVDARSWLSMRRRVWPVASGVQSADSRLRPAPSRVQPCGYGHGVAPPRTRSPSRQRPVHRESDRRIRRARRRRRLRRLG